MVDLGKVHVGDKGTEFQLLVQETDINNSNAPVDLSTTSTQEIIFTDPNGTEKTEVTASILNAPGSDGLIKYTNNDVSFFDEPGFWYYRAKLTFSGGDIFESSDASFEVLGSVE